MSKFNFNEMNYKIVAKVQDAEKNLDYSVVLAKYYSIPLAFDAMDILKNNEHYRKSYNKIYLIEIKENRIIEEI